MTEEVQKVDGEELKPEDSPPKKRRRRVATRKGPTTRRAKDKPVEYEGEKYRGVEIDDEGRLRLKEGYYTSLTLAEQAAKICERDLEIARLKEASYRREVESRLPPEVQREMANLAGKVQEANHKLAVARKQYRDEAVSIQEETGLELKQWLIDDMRRMRHVDKLT
jgi:hypothetical protein